MKQKLLATMGLFAILIYGAINSKVLAQTEDSKWGIGIHAGVTRLNDDFNNYYLKTSNVEKLVRLSIQRYVAPHLNVSANFAGGDVSTYNTIIQHSITTTIRTADFTLDFKFFSNACRWRPYVFLGAGVLYSDNFLNRTDYVPTFPHGVGIRMSPFGERLQFDANIRQDATLSDMLDGYSAGSYKDNFLTYSGGIVFLLGSNKDSDGDGVSDAKDQCPGTPKGVKVDDKGCPLDSDGDGVADYLDKCPNTPANVKVDATGCPLDSDGDGVADNLDKCPNTPANVKVDAAGCPLDTDGDGVPDYLDKCPNTSANMKVDATGCPLDADGDGVPDYLDKCPGTPPNVKVDNAGCPVDTDGDGIPDYLDKCPNIPGTAENHGCPEVKKEVKLLFQKALQGIKFETGKAIIRPMSYPILDAVVRVMQENPTYKLLIGGHTDNVGSVGSNMTLSQNRADAVANYLIEKGVSPLRISATGYGDTMPVDDNKTAAGRTVNRRVELKVEFIDKVKIEVGK